MKHIKQHLYRPKTHQIAGYSTNFWMKDTLFSVWHRINAVASND